VGIKPGRITLTASRLVRVSIPLEIVTENSPPPGVTIQKITATPSSLKVLLPSTVNRNKIKIQTVPIDLRAVTSPTTLTPKLIVPPDIQFEGGKQPAVKVVIRVRR
jgi:YbbR domain-containing protein